MYLQDFNKYIQLNRLSNFITLKSYVNILINNIPDRSIINCCVKRQDNKHSVIYRLISVICVKNFYQNNGD